ncbi:unnamed protein product [Brassicogethes aeneus]|uniref:Uncharacterized protein n=1 Tax=Brassicogethes aeneus TaxID=1431903 RepID=A0A9P0BAA4_BRAAE|nr:unnamed protein product [Brassicogethes aeneus]
MNPDSMKLYTYFPYKYENVHQPNLEIHYLNECLDNKRNIFPSKIPKLWRNTTLNLGYIEIPPYVEVVDNKEINGFEVYVYKALQSILKFKITYKEKHTQYGYQLEKHLLNTGALKSINDKTIDSAIGLFQGKSFPYNDFDMTFSFCEEYVSWVAPREYKRTSFKRITNIFDKTIWFSYLTYFACISVFLYVNSMVLGFRKDLVKCVMQSLSIALSTSSKTVDFWSTRLATQTFRFIVIIVYALFTSKLILLQTEDGNVEDLSNFKDIISSKYYIGLTKGLEEIFEGYHEENEKYIYENHIICRNLIECLNKTAFDKTVVTASPQWVTDYTLPIYYINQDGKSLIYINKKKYFWMILVNWYFTKGFPMFLRINQLLYRLKSVGIIYRYYSLTYNIIDVLNQLSMARFSLIYTKPLNLTHFEGAVTILTFGWTLSLIVFVMEVGLKYIKNKLCLK